MKFKRVLKEKKSYDFFNDLKIFKTFMKNLLEVTPKISIVQNYEGNDVIRFNEGGGSSDNITKYIIFSDPTTFINMIKELTSDYVVYILNTLTNFYSRSKNVGLYRMKGNYGNLYRKEEQWLKSKIQWTKEVLETKTKGE